MSYIEVALPVPLHGTFTYRVPDDSILQPGVRVLVPFGRRESIGICISQHQRLSKNLKDEAIKDIISVIDDEPSLSQNLLKLISWMSGYYVTPIGEAVRAALPRRMTDKSSPRTTRPVAPHETLPHIKGGVILNSHQRDAISTISKALDENSCKTFLLHGVTGSGKTEVYFNAFEKLIAMGRQGLLLVPEIGLTPQLTGLASSRFDRKVAVYHSGLTDAQRHEQWMKIKAGDADVVIGTRSALFAPLRRLGAIVVDEEHDSSYKQDEGFLYNARDAAVMRAHIEGIMAILGSATPSIESLANVRKKKYTLLSLPVRAGGSAMPSIEIVDVRKKTQRAASGLEAISQSLYAAIDDALSAKRQVLLFVGRRGFSGSVQCAACGAVLSCPNCDISLASHASRGGAEKLRCHYCDLSMKIPEKCPECGDSDLIHVGFGTERIEAEISDFFPAARTARLDSDTISSPKARRKILDDMRRGKIDILIGTQMVTKGHDFPDIALVGVVSADVTLAIPDFRSSERMFQLITQVSGRAGRGMEAGRVIVQTRQPDHVSLKAAMDDDFDEFMDAELLHRKELGYPPFTKLANIRISAAARDKAISASSKVKSELERIIRSRALKSIEMLGPAPAPIERLRARYRWQLLLKSKSIGELTAALSSFNAAIAGKVENGVKISVDVDPIAML
jgi:primosomal protein N' (replication factor Y)